MERSEMQEKSFDGHSAHPLPLLPQTLLSRYDKRGKSWRVKGREVREEISPE